MGYATGAGPVNSAAITDGSIVDADINASAAIAGTKLGALTGDVTKASGSAATVLAAGSATNLNSGTLPAARMPALTGDITTSAGAVATSLASNSVTLAKMATQAANTYLVNNTSGAAVPTAVAMPYVVDPNATNALLGWTFDPTACTSGGNITPSAATIYLGKIPIPKSITITNIVVHNVTAGTSYTNAQLGLYDSTGALLSSSAVQASAGTNGFGVNTTTVSLALAASQAIVGSATAFVWAALHMGTNSATSAIVRGAPTFAATANAGTSTSTLRTATYTGHATNNLATIGSLTPTSMVGTGSFIWFAIT